MSFFMHPAAALSVSRHAGFASKTARVQAAALWPELHAIERALKAGTLSCSSPAR